MNKCGTNAGYQKHCVDKTNKCDLCKNAHYEYLKSYYLKNEKKLKEKRSKKYLENQNEMILKSAQYRANNPDASKNYQKKYRQLNPESKRSSERRRRAKKFENGYEMYKESLILDLYGSECHICLMPIDLSAPRQSGLDGWEMGLHIDHVIPLSKGGPDTIENVRPSHGSCNVKKHASTLSK